MTARWQLGPRLETDLGTGDVTLRPAPCLCSLDHRDLLSLGLSPGGGRLHKVSGTDILLLCSGDLTGGCCLQGGQRTVVLVIVTVLVTIAPLTGRNAPVVTAPELLVSTLHITVCFV